MEATDLKLYHAVSENDTPSNGGRESAVEVVSAVMENLFPSVPHEERLAGGTRLRKVFFRNANASGEAGSNARAYFLKPSTAEDFFILILGDAEDTQGDLLGTEKQYASGLFAVQGSAGATEIQVDFDDVDEVDLADGDLLWLGIIVWDAGLNKWKATSQMFTTVNGAPSWASNRATIDLDDQLNTDYPIGSICAMVIICGDAGALACEFDSWAENSPAGTYNETTYPPELDNEGCVRDDWTLTFTDATHFTATGLTSGNVGSGTTGADFAPLNPNTAKPYFTLRAAGWGGTWAAGDTITFKTYPASQGLWAKEIWPAAATADSNNRTQLRLYIE